MRHQISFPEYLKIAVKTHFNQIPPLLFPVNENTTKYLHDAPLLSLLSERLNFRYELHESVDGEYGNMLPDGNWTGVVGMVDREEVDLGFAELSLTEARAEVVDFSFPYFYIPITFMTDNPAYLPNKYAVVSPFTSSVWIATLISLLLFQCVSYIFRMSRYSFQSLWLSVYAILVQQPLNLNLQKLSSKILMLSWMLGTTILALSFKVVLLSFLSFPSLVGIRDIQQLSKATESGSFKCATYKGSMVFIERLEGGEESWKKIVDCVIRSKMNTADVESFLRPVTYKKAFIGERSYLNQWDKVFYLPFDSFFVDFIGVAVRKTFCCRRVLDETIHRIAAVGILRKFERDQEFFLALKKMYLVDERLQEGGGGGDPNEQLSLEDFTVAFVILAVGNGMVFAALIVERIRGRRCRKKKNKNSRIRRRMKIKHNHERISAVEFSYLWDCLP